MIRPVVLQGDMLEVLKTLPANHFHACVTDPPYALESITKRFGKAGSAPAKHGTDGAFARQSRGFMNALWDTKIAFDPATWAEVYRVMRPGAYLAAFGGTRTFYRMAVAIEDAGFVYSNTIVWAYGQGMPHSHSVMKDIDKKLGKTGTYGEPKSEAHAGWIERGRMRGDGSENEAGWQRPWMADPEAVANAARRYIPATPEAAAWEGYGSDLKPSFEPIILAQKPRDKTLANNAMKWGCGLLNIDGCRTDGEQGRWPSNLWTDGSDEVRAAFPDAGGAAAPVRGTEPSDVTKTTFNKRARVPSGPVRDEEDKCAARFFTTCPLEDGIAPSIVYSPKPGKADRQGTTHPTTKGTSLLRTLVRLVCPTGGTVLDPFAGSGSTGTACMREGYGATLIEREDEYVAMIRTRIAAEMGEVDQALPNLTDELQRELDALLSPCTAEDELNALLSGAADPVADLEAMLMEVAA